MKWLVCLVVMAAMVSAENRPQPRQLFRDDGGQFISRRPTLLELRQKRKKASIGQLPLGPEPVFGPEEVGFEDLESFARDGETEDSDSLFDLGAFSVPHLPPYAKEEQEGEEGGFHFEENTDKLPEYVKSEERHNTDDQTDPILNFIDEDYAEEERSPAHRYPDEREDDEDGSPVDQTSASTIGDQHVTSIPTEDDDFSPFALFKSDNPETFSEGPSHRENPTHRERPKEDQRLRQESRSPVKRRFRVRSPAQERNFDARESVRSQSTRPAPNDFTHRQRHPTRYQTSQPLLQNLNHAKRPYEEESQHQQQPRRQHRPQHELTHNAVSPDYANGPDYSNNNPDYSDYDDEEKPDRLSVLLLESKFNCKSRKDGYYADEDVNCEVFHFCQDGVKHSWLCPNNAAFHQVHLICMPRSEDNICERSSKFHFVNDFLYKEVGDHPENRSYVERYYPQGYEGGVANIPDNENGVPPQAPPAPKFYRPGRDNERPAPPPDYQRRPQHFSSPAEGGRPHYQNQERRQHLREQAPIVQESVNQQAYHTQSLSNPFTIEKKKPNNPNEKRKFQLSRPSFNDDSPQSFQKEPSFEEERPRPHHSRPHPDELHHQQSERPHQRPDRPHQQQSHQRPDRPIQRPDGPHQQRDGPQQDFDSPQFQPNRPGGRRPHPRPQPGPFRPVPGADPVFESHNTERFQPHRPTHGAPPPPPHHRPEFGDRPSANFREHRPQVSFEPQHDREQPRPSFAPHSPPVYHPQQPFYSPPPHNIHEASSIELPKFRIPENRPLVQRDASSNPLSFLG